ncbi:hypothetical protein D3C72_2084410 [compost metagenome]
MRQHAITTCIQLYLRCLFEPCPRRARCMHDGKTLAKRLRTGQPGGVTNKRTANAQ